MNKLSKEKKSQLILVAMMAGGIVACLWFFVITSQREKIANINAKIDQVQKKVSDMDKQVRGASQLDDDLKLFSAHLTGIEDAMPSGDQNFWMVSVLKQFVAAGYKVDLPSISPPTVSAVTMLPSFPYNQITVSVGGSAYYSDFGRFLADFENHFPQMRLQNLNLEPGAGTTPEEQEKLRFNMQIITLVKTNSI